MNNSKKFQELQKKLFEKPVLNSKSQEINKKLNKGNYSGVHDRLFYKGIEQKNLKAEKSSIEFTKRHPFSPNIAKKMMDKHNTSTITKKTAEEMFKRFMQKNEFKEGKLKIIRKIENRYDPKNGQKLYQPKISKRKFLEQKVELKSQKFFVKDCEEFIKKCRQIFEFLDDENEGLVYVRKVNSKVIHRKTVALLTPILIQLLSEEHSGNSGVNFPMFYKMIRDADLEEQVEKVFDVISSQPLMRAKRKPPFRI